MTAIFRCIGITILLFWAECNPTFNVNITDGPIKFSPGGKRGTRAFDGAYVNEVCDIIQLIVLIISAAFILQIVI